MRKLLGPLLLVLLIVGVGYAIRRSVADSLSKRAAARAAAEVVAVRGLVGSEKIGYLSDPRVLAVLRQHGIDLKIEKSGSREMAVRSDLKKYDFAFPAGVPAATRLARALGVSKSYQPFFTPMTIASWKPIVDVLIANGIARQTDSTTVTLDLHKLIPIIQSGRRWRDLPHNPDYAIGRSVLVSTTDVRTSNSAAMFLALATYVLNGDNVVQSDAEVARVLPTASQFFLRQGFQEASSAGPFEDYLTMGMGKAPMVLIYEAQYIEYLLRNGHARPGMVLVYPQPTIYTKHVFVPLTPAGERLGGLLEQDSALQHLAAEYGLRTADPGYEQGLWRGHGLSVPAELLDVADPPSYEVLERMITSIEREMACASSASPGACADSSTSRPRAP